ncbi:nucleotidyltransferase family protein [Patescibacteria group bacterium]|nr:nucleotidyltransferase family protein [Patescibacteria group bacterium]
MKYKVNEKTAEVLRKFSVLMNSIGNNFFFVVMGGIAVDGYAGKLTRNHPDVDMLIFRKDLGKAEEVLEALGYTTKRFTHPKDSNLEYKVQTGNKDHLFSFQIIDKIDDKNFEISFYRNLHLVFPLSYIKPPTWLKLEGVKFPAVSKKMLTKLKENEVQFFEKLKKNDLKKYLSKRKQKHINTLYDLKTLNAIIK